MLQGLEPRRNPKHQARRGAISQLNDELEADMLQTAIHSPLAQLALDRLGPRALTMMFPYRTNVNEMTSQGLDPSDLEGITYMGTKQAPFVGVPPLNNLTPQDFRHSAMHGYSHRGMDYIPRSIGSNLEEFALRIQDRPFMSPSRRQKSEALLTKWYGDRKNEYEGLASTALKDMNTRAKEVLQQEGRYITPPPPSAVSMADQFMEWLSQW